MGKVVRFHSIRRVSQQVSGSPSRGYQYSHDFEGGWVKKDYLPEDRRYYQPGDRDRNKYLEETLPNPVQ
jgi:replication-associated recombination protein RarA